MSDKVQEHASRSGATDEVMVEVKGPGKQWRKRDEMLAEQEYERRVEQEDIRGEIKGPGPEWETDARGEYINREDDE